MARSPPMEARLRSVEMSQTFSGDARATRVLGRLARPINVGQIGNSGEHLRDAFILWTLMAQVAI